MERNERLLDHHMTEYVRRERDLYRGYSQGIDVDVSFYTQKMNQHRKMASKYAASLGISQETVSHTINELRKQAQGVA